MEVTETPVYLTPDQRALALLDPLETYSQSEGDEWYGRSKTRTYDALHATQRLEFFRPQLTDELVNSPVAFRHSCWKNERKRLRQVMHDAGVNEKRLERWDQCGSNTWVYAVRDQPDKYLLVGNYCRDRWCVPCARQRSRAIAQGLYQHLQDKPHRAITLTLRSADAPLKERINRLYSAFNRLRTRKLWKKTVAGGISFLELKWSVPHQSWHTHLHILCHGKYIPIKQLSAEWLAITNDSYIVNVSLIREPKLAAQYVAKYASKGVNSRDISNNDKLAEAIQALRGRRLFTTFGDWRKLSLRPPTRNVELVAIAPLTELLGHAIDGDPAAIAIVDAIYRRSDPHDHPQTRPP